MLSILTFPPSQHIYGMQKTSSCLQLLIPANPCSTGTSLDVGVFLGFHFPTSHPGLYAVPMAQSWKSRAGVARACPAGISNFREVYVQRGPGRGFFLGHCHILWVLTPFPGSTQCSVVAASDKVATPAAPASHLSLHKSREYSQAPILALSRIPNGTGNFGDGVCLPVWNVKPCKPLFFGSVSLERPFLPVTYVPSCAGAAQSRIPLD